MKIKSYQIALFILIAVFGGYALTNNLGLWQTSRSKAPQKYEAVTLSDTYNPDDIRGSYSFGEISRFYGIPIDDLAIAFNIASIEEAENFQCKSLETIFEEAKLSGKEIGTNSVKTFVALYASLPFQRSDDTYLPASAVELLKEKAILTEGALEYLDTHTY